jgi:ammonia channel protein AmtB
LANLIKTDQRIPFLDTIFPGCVGNYHPVLWLFGFNPGSSLGFTGGLRNLAILAAVNTLLAGAAGGMSAMFYMWWFSKAKKPDPSMSVNGVLAVLCYHSSCAFVDVWLLW